ncbi:MAG: glycosyltransferase [Prevotellaceae bacterium]|nr:glycosyltransferase [Prevotellaceae bacterium]
MNNHLVLSIIIPLYNCEKYIKQCLDTIFRQEMNESDFEVIVIDDGSKDSSYSLASEYAKRHQNIFVVKQENQGVACARNNALEKATGDYVTFVDADDMLVSGSLSTLIKIAVENKADIVKAAHKEVPEDAVCEDFSSSHDNCSTQVMTGEEAIVNVTRMKEGYCWGYLISRKLITDNNLKFPPKVAFMEDWAFITQAILKSRTFVNADVLLYLYRRNSSSCMANVTTEKMLLGCNAIDIVANLVKDTSGDVRKKLSDNVCVNINIVLWFTIHYRCIFIRKKEIIRVLLQLLQTVDRTYIPGSLKVFRLFPSMYIIVRNLLASRKY